MADSAHLSMVPFQTFPTSDGRIVVACPKENLWQRLCEALDRPELAADPRFATFADRSRNRDDLVTLLAGMLQTRRTDEWLALFEARGVPCGAVNTVDQAFADEQAQARDAVVEYEHPTFGTVRMARSPLRLGDVAYEPPRRGPYLGEHTYELLHDLVGYDDETIDELQRRGVVRTLVRQEA